MFVDVVYVQEYLIQPSIYPKYIQNIFDSAHNINIQVCIYIYAEIDSKYDQIYTCTFVYFLGISLVEYNHYICFIEIDLTHA